MVKKKLSSNENDFQQIIGWKPPVFHQASECYVSLSAFDPVIGKMHIKKIMLGHIKGKRQQRLYGQELIKRLTQRLLEGWNPWVEAAKSEEYALFSDVCDGYEKYLAKMVKEGSLKPGTVNNYTDKLLFFEKWIKEKNLKITYIYQFDKILIGKFLDYILIERNNTLRTKNNYIGWLKSFSSYLLVRGYVSNDPSASFGTTTRLGPKNRSIIPDAILVKVKNFLQKENKHFLLVCYMLHYLFVRPHEMTFIKIKDISRERKTLILRGVHTKNRHDAVITIPNHVIALMVELEVFSSQPENYLFSQKFRPGPTAIRTEQFARYWKEKVKTSLGLGKEYKFYSLKDTGITNMIRANTDLLSVRDQARHSSVEMTNIYTPQELKKANNLLIGYEGVF